MQHYDIDHSKVIKHSGIMWQTSFVDAIIVSRVRTSRISKNGHNYKGAQKYHCYDCDTYGTLDKRTDSTKEQASKRLPLNVTLLLPKSFSLVKASQDRLVLHRFQHLKMNVSVWTFLVMTSLI